MLYRSRSRVSKSSGYGVSGIGTTTNAKRCDGFFANTSSTDFCRLAKECLDSGAVAGASSEFEVDAAAEEPTLAAACWTACSGSSHKRATTSCSSADTGTESRLSPTRGTPESLSVNQPKVAVATIMAKEKSVERRWLSSK